METKRSDNLCNFYILPLIGLNKTSFGGIDNFVNSYISTDHNNIIVELKEAKSSFEEHPNFVADYRTEKETTMIIFSVPVEFKATIIKFKEGKYSQFPSQVKQLIKQKSGLNNRVPVGGGTVRTARELLALDRHEDLRRTLEFELAIKIDKEAELWDIPKGENFMNLTVGIVHQG